MSAAEARPKIHIGKVIRDAVALDPKKWNGEAVNADTLLQTVARLFALLHERNIDYDSRLSSAA